MMSTLSSGDSIVTSGLLGAGTNRIGPLPEPALLLRAVRGAGLIEHPLAKWAAQLVLVHELAVAEGPVDVWALDRRRVGLVHKIDLWIEQYVPQHRHGAALHTETIGSVIDRIAASHVHAVHLLKTHDIQRDPRVHNAWNRLAELVGGYGDLAVDVVVGRRRLPAPMSP